MTKIICDTMIWYELSKGSLKIPDPNKYKLVCTHLTLTELAFTPNNFKNLGEIQEVIKKILNIDCDFILDYPFHHAWALIDSDVKLDYKIEEDLVMAFLRVLLNHPKDGLIHNDFRNQLSEVTFIRRENSIEWANFLNELCLPTKDISGILKRYHDEEFNKNYFRDLVVFHLNQLSEKNYSKDSIDWKQLELYEKAGARYRRNMLLSKMKADRNDESDLKNLIYVQPDDKYWTLEKRWRSIIKEINLDKYLYTQ